VLALEGDISIEPDYVAEREWHPSQKLKHRAES